MILKDVEKKGIRSFRIPHRRREKGTENAEAVLSFANENWPLLWEGLFREDVL